MSAISLHSAGLDFESASQTFNSVALESARVLSASGAFEGSVEEKNLLCLLSDGRLLIARGHELNPHVLSYRARLEKMKRPFQVVCTSIEAIGMMYQTCLSENSSRQNVHSVMQVSAKDLLAKACRARASDIHIRVKRNCTDIYFRVHNDLLKVSGHTRENGERLLATLYGAMASVSDSSYKPTERQDASIADRDKLPPQLNGVRIATAPTNEGSVMVLRLLYNDPGDNIDFRPLGFTDAQAGLLQQLKEQPIGMNIISGPTGSGKSTTLQRVLSGEIIEEAGRLHVLTVEDPVEYPINGAVQTAVTNAGTEGERSLKFSAAIANAMRLDPDTIMIGEVRDNASAQNALRASMTGHQVWTTVHANSALAIVDRLIDLGLPMGLVSDHTIITGLISQRLVKVLCSECKKKLHENLHLVAPAVLQRVRQVAGTRFNNVFIAGDGCPHCKGETTTGRSVIAEIILPDAAFFDLIRAGEKNKAMQYWLKELGGKTLLEHAIEKVVMGIVDPQMAEKVVGHLTLGAHQQHRNLAVSGDAYAH